MRARLTATAALTVLLASAEVAAAEPAPSPVLVQTVEPRLLCVPPMPSTTCRELPPGRFVDAGTWARIDAEHRRLQDSETRLIAENRSLRASADEWRPGWKTLATALAVGIGVGWYAASRE